MSVLSKAPRPSGDDVKRVALAALAAALEDGKQEKPEKRSGGAMKGVKTVFIGTAADSDRVKAAAEPAGVKYVFVEAK